MNKKFHINETIQKVLSRRLNIVFAISGFLTFIICILYLSSLKFDLIKFIIVLIIPFSLFSLFGLTLVDNYIPTNCPNCGCLILTSTHHCYECDLPIRTKASSVIKKGRTLKKDLMRKTFIPILTYFGLMLFMSSLFAYGTWTNPKNAQYCTILNSWYDQVHSGGESMLLQNIEKIDNYDPTVWPAIILIKMKTNQQNIFHLVYNLDIETGDIQSLIDKSIEMKCSKVNKNKMVVCFPKSYLQNKAQFQASNNLKNTIFRIYRTFFYSIPKYLLDSFKLLLINS